MRAKSPTWATTLPPKRLVLLVRDSAANPEELGALTRDISTVASYLSEAKSHWTPLNSGLEKVIGVRVVRIWLPRVIA